MVFVDLEGVISESRRDPFAALAANILLGLDLEIAEEQVEKDLAGKIMLSLLKEDQDLFLECTKAIERRSLADDNDEWVYNEYLAFFTVYGAITWREGTTAAKRIIEYRTNTSKDDHRAAELLNVLNGTSHSGVIPILLAEVRSNRLPATPTIESYNAIKDWMARQHSLIILDRILIATIQKSWVQSLILKDPTEREAVADAVRSIHSIAQTHAKAEYWLSFTLILLLSVIFVAAFFLGPANIRVILSTLLTMGLVAPLSLIYTHFKWREGFIRYRANKIFTQLSSRPMGAYEQTLKQF